MAVVDGEQQRAAGVGGAGHGLRWRAGRRLVVNSRELAQKAEGDVANDEEGKEHEHQLGHVACKQRGEVKKTLAFK